MEPRVCLQPTLDPPLFQSPTPQNLTIQTKATRIFAVVETQFKIL